jgi:hypothetical protein
LSPLADQTDGSAAACARDPVDDGPVDTLVDGLWPPKISDRSSGDNPVVTLGSQDGGMVTMVAPPPGWTRRTGTAGLQERTAQRLASALRSLVARDDEPPSVWRSASFADGVEAIRTSLAEAHTPSAIDHAATVLLDGDVPTDWSFALAAQRLARDPAAVAIAVRWLEVAGRVVLLPWPEVVRHRSLEPAGYQVGADAELWFG